MAWKCSGNISGNLGYDAVSSNECDSDIETVYSFALSSEKRAVRTIVLSTVGSHLSLLKAVLGISNELRGG